MAQDLPHFLKWRPWPPGDPGPEIMSIIVELSKRTQVDVAKAVLDTQIAMSRAHTEGLTKIHKLLGESKPG